MRLVNIEVTDDESFVIHLRPIETGSFVVATITVVDESLTPVWMLVADNAAIATTGAPAH